MQTTNPADPLKDSYTYRVGPIPSIPGSDDQYLFRELRKIERITVNIAETLVKLDARLKALEP